VAPKSRKGTRRVPIPASLRPAPARAEDADRPRRRRRCLRFGGRPAIHPTHIRKLALGAWKRANAERREQELPELRPIGLHELRHSYVSTMHAAGFSLERIGDYVGHSSTYMTDAYRHLLEGHEAEAAELFESFLVRATGAHTGAQRAEAAPLSGI
jgi:integrase